MRQNKYHNSRNTVHGYQNHGYQKNSQHAPQPHQQQQPTNPSVPPQFNRSLSSSQIPNKHNPHVQINQLHYQQQYQQQAPHHYPQRHQNPNLRARNPRNPHPHHHHPHHHPQHYQQAPRVPIASIEQHLDHLYQQQCQLSDSTHSYFRTVKDIGHHSYRHNTNFSQLVDTSQHMDKPTFDLMNFQRQKVLQINNNFKNVFRAKLPTEKLKTDGF